jgi:hypothetical protein
MEESIMVNGNKIRWMDKVSLLGVMEGTLLNLLLYKGNMLVLMLMIRNMVMENSIGRIRDHIGDIGRMGNNMEEAFIEELLAKNVKGNGSMDKK